MKKVGRKPHKATSNKVREEYRAARKRALSKIRYYKKKNPGIEINAPVIPKTIKASSVRKLERFAEKLSKVAKQGKLEKVYGEKKYEVPDEPTTDWYEAPDFEEIVVDDYVNFIMRAYDDTYTESYLSLGNKQHSNTLSIVKAHADNCLDMLRSIGAFDDSRRKSIVYNLVNDRVRIYNETDQYIFGYESLRAGIPGSIEVLHAIEEMLTRAITGEGLSQEAQEDYNNILSENVEWGDIYE